MRGNLSSIKPADGCFIETSRPLSIRSYLDISIAQRSHLRNWICLSTLHFCSNQPGTLATVTVSRIMGSFLMQPLVYMACARWSSDRRSLACFNQPWRTVLNSFSLTRPFFKTLVSLLGFEVWFLISNNRGGHQQPCKPNVSAR